MQVCVLPHKKVLRKWQQYGLGIPDFIPVCHYALVGKCNNAIVRLLDMNGSMRRVYHSTQGCDWNWLTVLKETVKLGWVEQGEYDQIYIYADANNMLPKVTG